MTLFSQLGMLSETAESRYGTVSLPLPDTRETIPLTWQIIWMEVAGQALPIVEYALADTPGTAERRTVLVLGGGGCCGAQFARVAQLCAGHGIRLVMFDQPGRTPPGFLGEGTPPSSLVKLSGPGRRRRIIDRMIERWMRLAPSGSIEIAAHSAGFLDASRIAPSLAAAIQRYTILGSALPGFAAMRNAYRAATEVNAASKLNLFEILRSRQAPTGQPHLHFGPRDARVLGDEELERLMGAEHIGVVLNLLRRSAFGTAIWRNVRVDLVCSAGDRIAPEALMRQAADALRSFGADVRFHQIGGTLPHMFFMFEAGAAAVADVICSSGARA